ncbi:DUF1565 domain-containing protein, partial [Methanobrevibacter sp.]
MLCIIGTASATEESLNENLTTTDVDEVGIDDANELLSALDNEEELGVDGDTLYVDSSVENDGDGSENSPFKTITSAVTKVNSGDGGETIFIKNGVYSEPRMTLSKGVSFIGES